MNPKKINAPASTHGRAFEDRGTSLDMRASSRGSSARLRLFVLLAAACTLGACSATGDRTAFDISGNGGAGGNGGGSGGSSPSGTGDDWSDIDLAGDETGSSGETAPGGDPTTCAQAAAKKTYIGCDFWPTVVDNLVDPIFDYAVVVANAGDQPADVEVTRNGATVGRVQVEPDGLSTIYLPWVDELKAVPPPFQCAFAQPFTSTVRAVGGAYHLVASRPVTVYQFNAIEYQGVGGPPGKDWSTCPGDECGVPGCYSFTNDASLLLPSTAMTGNYRITGQMGWGEGGIGPYFAVTGTADNTSVTVHVAPAGQIMGGGEVASTPGGGVTTFSLNAGDVVEVVGSPYSDFSGSLVKASHPVQVITGIACTQSPIGVAACDHLEESVFPAETLGKHYFVTVPTSPHGEVVGHGVRIYGNADGTALTYPGPKPSGAPDIVNAGQVVDLGVVSEDFEVVGDHELAVGSFQLGAQFVEPDVPVEEPWGDPAQSLATAVEQYRTKYIFLAPPDYEVSFVDIVQPLNAEVTLDGSPVTRTPQAISSTFGVNRIRLGPGTNGAHVLKATMPVGIQVMGYGAYTSYQYPGGLNLTAIAPPPPR